jgi:hypothetical protein
MDIPRGGCAARREMGHGAVHLGKRGQWLLAGLLQSI